MEALPVIGLHSGFTRELSIKPRFEQILSYLLLPSEPLLGSLDGVYRVFLVALTDAVAL